MSGPVGDNTARASGVIASAGGGGKVLSQEWKGWNTISSVNPGGYDSWSDVGSASQTITPTAAGSSILINCGITTGATDTGSWKVLGDIDGAGYNILFEGATDGSRAKSSMGTAFEFTSEGMRTLHGPWLWTPSYTLTDVLTVKFQISGNSTRYLNRVKATGSHDYNATGYSTILLQEIGA
jgi:hypothetical protein